MTAALAVEQLAIVGGLYIRTTFLPLAGTSIPQHVHDHDHVTLVCAGKVRAWCDGVLVGDKGPGEVYEIPAGTMHVFETLAPMTRIACIHDVASAESLARRGL